MDETDLRLLERQAEICRALGSPKRLQIIYLLQEGEVSAGDLAVALQTTAANVSQHLSAMNQTGITTSRREGKSILYGLSSPVVLQACAMVRRMLKENLKREQGLLEKHLSVSNSANP